MAQFKVFTLLKAENTLHFPFDVWLAVEVFFTSQMYAEV